MIPRNLAEPIRELAFKHQKMAFVSGPRQCGKTTLARMLSESYESSLYYNWDDIEFRKQWQQSPRSIVPEDAEHPLLVLDEIHKERTWKRTLKGVFDTLSFDKVSCDILVTGSARLNVYRKGSDSLMGRYFHFRLSPLSLVELAQESPADPGGILDVLFERSRQSGPEDEQLLKNILEYGPFPEPLVRESREFYNAWRRSRHDLIIREDLRDLSRLNDLSKIETLAAILPDKVGSPLSIASLRDDLEKSHDTIKLWMNWLKELYFHFEVKPWSKKIKRSLRREGKIYLWDFNEISEPGPRFENLVAVHLLKACNFWTDSGKGEFELYYLRDRDGAEIDFLIVRDGEPWLPVEVKTGTAMPSPHWRKFLPMLGCKRGLQITDEPTWKVFAEGDHELLIAGAAEVLMYLV